MRALLKRCWFWMLLLSQLVLVTGLLIALMPKDHLQAKLDRIENGMMKGHVVAIIGTQPTTAGGWEYRGKYQEDCYWLIGDAAILVSFENGRVTDHHLFPPPTIIERIHSWLQQYG